MLQSLFLETDYDVMFGQKIDGDASKSLLTVQPVMTMKIITSIPILPTIKRESRHITYVADNARLAEEDLFEEMVSVAYCENLEGINENIKEKVVENASTDLMLKALTYRSRYWSNTQNMTLDLNLHKRMTPSESFSYRIAEAIQFAKEKIPENKFVAINRAMMLTLSAMN